MAYGLWILDYPKKKEKDVDSFAKKEIPKFQRSGLLENLSIEEQKLLLLAPTLIEYDEENF